jgi:hypothetical protein
MPRTTADQAIITGVSAALNYGLTATSQSVIESVALRVAGPGPDTAGRRMTQRGVILAGDVAAMGIGIAAQRLLAHREDEPIARAWGRTSNWRLAAGGMAGAIIVAGDMLLERVGGDRPSSTRNALIALPLGAGLAAWHHRLRSKMLEEGATHDAQGEALVDSGRGGRQGRGHRGGCLGGPVPGGEGSEAARRRGRFGADHDEPARGADRSSDRAPGSPGPARCGRVQGHGGRLPRG